MSCARRWARSARRHGWSGSTSGCTPGWPSGDHRRHRRRAVREDQGVRQLRLPRESLGVVRLPRVGVVVDQVPRAGGVLRGAPERPADGVLEPAHLGPRRPPPRRRRAHPGPQRLAGRRHSNHPSEVCSHPRVRPPLTGRKPSDRSASARRAAGPWVGAGVGENLPSRSRPSVSRAGPIAIPRTSCGGSPPWTWRSSRRWPPAGCSVSASGCPRREALWAVGAVAESRPDRLAGVVTGAVSPPLPGMSLVEEAVADLSATGVAPDGHPTSFLRRELDALGVVTSQGLSHVTPGSGSPWPASSPTASGR